MLNLHTLPCYLLKAITSTDKNKDTNETKVPLENTESSKKKENTNSIIELLEEKEIIVNAMHWQRKMTIKGVNE